MTLNWKTTYFPVFGINISQTVCTAVARLPLRQLGFHVYRILLIRFYNKYNYKKEYAAMSLLVVCSVVCLYLERRQVLLAGFVSSSVTAYPKSSSVRLLESPGVAVQTKYIIFPPVCPAAAAAAVAVDDDDDGD